MIKLILGLKNPGVQYAHTRHNAGAWLVEALIQKNNLNLKSEKKFQMELAEFSCEDQRVFFGLPISYMNESGSPVALFAKFYQLDPSEILIAHDELDFAPGIIKLKQGGSHGGHNGLRDIIAKLGSNDFYRLRIGIGHPGHRDKVVGYVLHKPPLDEKIEIDRAIERGLDVFPDILRGEIARATQTLHT